MLRDPRLAPFLGWHQREAGKAQRAPAPQHVCANCDRDFRPGETAHHTVTRTSVSPGVCRGCASLLGMLRD